MLRLDIQQERDLMGQQVEENTEFNFGRFKLEASMGQSDHNFLEYFQN